MIKSSHKAHVEEWRESRKAFPDSTRRNYTQKWLAASRAGREAVTTARLPFSTHQRPESLVAAAFFVRGLQGAKQIFEGQEPIFGTNAAVTPHLTAGLLLEDSLQLNIPCPNRKSSKKHLLRPKTRRFVLKNDSVTRRYRPPNILQREQVLPGPLNVKISTMRCCWASLSQRAAFHMPPP